MVKLELISHLEALLDHQAIQAVNEWLVTPHREPVHGLALQTIVLLHPASGADFLLRITSGAHLSLGSPSSSSVLAGYIIASPPSVLPPRRPLLGPGGWARAGCGAMDLILTDRQLGGGAPSRSVLLFQLTPPINSNHFRA